MMYICVCTGEDVGTVPAEAVCFKRVYMKSLSSTTLLFIVRAFHRNSLPYIVQLNNSLFKCQLHLIFVT